MKKMILMLALAVGFCLPQAGQAQAAQGNAPAQKQMQGEMQNQGAQYDNNAMQNNAGDAHYYQGQGNQGYQGYQGHGGFEGAAYADHLDPNQEYTVGDVQSDGCGNCYCMCCKYEPCYYNSYRTECTPVTCKKKCCHYVPRYYEKCCVRYVPQNYTQTCCKYEPEYYYVDECKYVSKRVCDRHCKYVPKYYYKSVASQNSCCEQTCCQ